MDRLEKLMEYLAVKLSGMKKAIINSVINKQPVEINPALMTSSGFISNKMKLAYTNLEIAKIDRGCKDKLI